MELDWWAAAFESDSATCAEVKPSQFECCPSEAEPLVDDFCDVCPNGLSVATDTVAVDGSTCGDIIIYGKTLNSTDANCTAILPVSQVCCPEDNVGCPFCEQGVANPDLVLSGPTGNVTCASLESK